MPLELFQYLLLRPGQLPKLIEETFLALAFAPETLIGLIAALAPHDRQRQCARVARFVCAGGE
ncbi:MAG: hypothetical protein KIG15_04710, partial [Coriobacteriales bacterium]|nr:hypothetical protein [Coriobacteriales bacterium]